MALKHRIYGFIFNLFRIFKVKKNAVTFITDNEGTFNENFKYVCDELKRQKGYELNLINKNSFSVKNFHILARSNYIFLNDNFFPLAYMNVSAKTKVTQLWHGSGAFKKFGYSVVSSEDIDLISLIKKSAQKIDYITVTSENVKKFYAEAFQVNESKILSYGIPRLDYYNKENLSNDNIYEIRNKFERKWPEIKNKKIILYAPTFRENEKYNDVFKYLNIIKLMEELGENYALFIRLHPKMNKINKNEKHESIYDLNNVYDLNNYENSEELLLASDILITDYSSIMVEYSILDRPIIFFAYDLDNYLDNERGFYFDYRKEVPGKIVSNTDELIDTILNEDFNLDNLNNFKNFQFDYLDGNCTKRILNYIMKD